MIAIVDYGVSNLLSVKKALDWLGQEAVVTSNADVVARANKIILPGVGHFSTTSTLDSAGLRSVIEEAVARGVPLLGICLGMQWLFAASQEAPGVRGLGVFEGECVRFPRNVKSPHVGWNQLGACRTSRLLDGIPSGAFVYFTHSYRAPLTEATVAETEYGERFAAVVEQDHIFGVQFHPEKSGTVGLRLLENFCSFKC
jgi:imidazole glycerol-phosphate synthase subunit HisH